MDGKQGGDQGAGPEAPGHLAKDQEQENRRRAVKQNAGQMMPTRVQTVELAIQHVGECGERMPVGLMRVGEGPGDAGAGETAFGHRVLVNIDVIVEIDELVLEGLAENEPDQGGEREADAHGCPPASRRGRRGRRSVSASHRQEFGLRADVPSMREGRARSADASEWRGFGRSRSSLKYREASRCRSRGGFEQRQNRRLPVFPIGQA